MTHSLYIITGANKGFGRCIAFNICKKIQDPLQLILVGRDNNSLQIVKHDIEQQGHSHVKSIDIISHPHILDNAETTSQFFLPALDTLISPMNTEINNITLINNAGSTGDLSKKVSEYSLENIQQYIDLNITSYITLNSGVLQLYGNKWKTENNQLTLVNISSLLAIQPFSNWGLYATSKAARDMMMGVISKEHKTDVRTLSYAPGPLDNEMQKSVRETLGDPEQAILYTDMANKGNLVKMDDSVLKLIKLLQENTYSSGAHIDYYDI
ncbi:unnamed protein product [Cunninghamella echinulata]